MTDADLAALVSRILVARIEESGIVVERALSGLTKHGNGDVSRAIIVRVPMSLLKEQHAIESDPIAIMRDKGLL